MSTDSFDLDSGAVCLDFANTLEWQASDQPVDRLRSMADLVRWGTAAGILDADQGQAIIRSMARKPEAAGMAFEQAIRLRDVVYRVFSGYTESQYIESDDLAALNETLAEAMAHLKIGPSPSGFDWQWREQMPGLERIGCAVVRSTADLLTSEQLDRTRQCADDRGCGYLFIDTSRNRSRRWCSMESCGNRAKARRHYNRKKG
jgi:predicted RNA-binding Zn ribbon-like protein